MHNDILSRGLKEAVFIFSIVVSFHTFAVRLDAFVHNYIKVVMVANNYSILQSLIAMSLLQGDHDCVSRLSLHTPHHSHSMFKATIHEETIKKNCTTHNHHKSTHLVHCPVLC